MPRRTRNDVAIAPMSPHVRGHPKRERTTRRVSEWTEAHPSRRRIARPGLLALARSLLRASSRRELQALRDDHGPVKDRGTRGHAQCVGLQTAKPDAPETSTTWRPRHIRDTSPHQPTNRSPPTGEVWRLGTSPMLPPKGRVRDTCVTKETTTWSRSHKGDAQRPVRSEEPAEADPASHKEDRTGCPTASGVDPP
jgi:hypothetical protein